MRIAAGLGRPNRPLRQSAARSTAQERGIAGKAVGGAVRTRSRPGPPRRPGRRPATCTWPRPSRGSSTTFPPAGRQFRKDLPRGQDNDHRPGGTRDRMRPSARSASRPCNSRAALGVPSGTTARRPGTIRRTRHAPMFMSWSGRLRPGMPSLRRDRMGSSSPCGGGAAGSALVNARCRPRSITRIRSSRRTPAIRLILVACEKHAQRRLAEDQHQQLRRPFSWRQATAQPASSRPRTRAATRAGITFFWPVQREAAQPHVFPAQQTAADGVVSPHR